MTQFVPNFSTQQLLPPWVSLGARSWVFAIKVPHKNLQDFLDSHFNCGAPDVAPYYYEAFEYPYGLLRVTKHDNFSSSHGGVPGTQTLRKIDVNWSYPVIRWRVSPDNIRYDKQYVWVEPMAFDNNSYSMFSSREIWGTEADQARICVEESKNPSRIHIDVGMQGLRTFTPKSISHLIGVMHVDMDTEELGDLSKELDKHPGLPGFMGVLFGSIALKGSGDGNRNNEVNTLKQFRDVFNMKVAVYRAIIASKSAQTNVSDFKFHAGSNVELDFMWSATMAESLQDYLGLEEGLGSGDPVGHPGGADKIDNKTIDWNLPRVRKDVALAASFTSDSRYDIVGTLHTYGN